MWVFPFGGDEAPGRQEERLGILRTGWQGWAECEVYRASRRGGVIQQGAATLQKAWKADPSKPAFALWVRGGEPVRVSQTILVFHTWSGQAPPKKPETRLRK